MRHAHAGDRERWEGPDEARPLTDKGWRQARALAEWLAPLRPAKLLSSPYVRCVQTLEPLAEALSLTVLEDHRLAEGEPAKLVLELLLSCEEDVVASTHGDIIPAILEKLWRTGLVEDARWAKGSTWVLKAEGGRITSARYVAP